MESKKQIIDFVLTPEKLRAIGEYPKYVKMSMNILSSYEKDAQYIPEKMAKNYESVDPKYLTRLNFNYKDKVEKVKSGIKTNQEFFDKILKNVGTVFDEEEYTDDDMNSFHASESPYVRKFFLHGVTVEWCDMGNEERKLYTDHILSELKKYFNYEDKAVMDKGIEVLVPSCKFGRLGYEILKKGYKVEMNCNSCFNQMIMDYLFNKANKYECEIVPRIYTFCSSFTAESVTKKHQFPNVDINEELKDIKPGYATFIPGDFVYQYQGTKDRFDAVVTLFGAEESRNIIAFVEIVNNILKKGGVWINFGGLDYCFSDYGLCYELTWDELRKVINNYGFEIKSEENKFVPYMKMEGCSLPYTCGAVIFTAYKK